MSTHVMHAAFSHKAAATQELPTQLRQHGEQLQPKNLHLATRLLNHLAVIDQIFLAHLRGEEHVFTATNTPATPTLAELIALQAQFDQAWLALLVQPACQDLSQEIEFVFTDGKPARMTVGDILLHVLTHASCLVSGNHIPMRSWPLFMARDIMHDLINQLTSSQTA